MEQKKAGLDPASSIWTTRQPSSLPGGFFAGFCWVIEIAEIGGLPTVMNGEQHDETQ